MTYEMKHVTEKGQFADFERSHKFPGYLRETLQRLDHWLRVICDEEERRAKLLAGDGARGWDGVRNLTRPKTESLAFFEKNAEPDLLPAGDHAFHRIGHALSLHTCEMEALLVVFAAHMEPRYQSLYAVLQDHLKQLRPTERLLLTVLGRTPRRHRILSDSLAPSGRLYRTGFLRTESGMYPPLGRPFSLSEEVVSVILGSENPRLSGVVGQQWTQGVGSEAVSIRRRVIHGTGDKGAFARELCGRRDRILWVDLPESYREALSAGQAAWRLGLALGALPLLDIHDLEEHDRVKVARSVESLTRDFGGAAWFLCSNPLPLSIPHLECHPPTWSQRRKEWLAEAAQRKVPLSPEAADRLASRYRLTTNEIREVLETNPENADQLDQSARRLGRTIVRHSLRTPTHRGFDDLVVRDTTRQALERLVYFVENRDRVAEVRNIETRYQLRRGPIVLFSGCSGTGKTLAAEVVAATLGRPLHTVDIARLVSKYIGDTEKHVDEILSQGERASAVLFFDEADVLFSTRVEKTSNAGEHFANMMVGYLLQRIERHDGIVILATNLRHAMDEAFLRRFEFRIEFPKPVFEERLRIWELMLPPTIRRTDDVDLEEIARAHRLVGGEIRNAALKAIFLAEREAGDLCRAHLEEAIALELLEMGRISRLPRPDAMEGPPDRGRLLRLCVEQVEAAIEAYLRPKFLKEIHVVHGSPTQENLAGKRPAVSIALFRLAAKRGGDGLRTGFILSAWSHRAEEEYELLGVVYEALLSFISPKSDPLQPSMKMRVQESHDFDLLHRFWSSHDHPVRASIVIDVEIDGK